MQFCCGPPTGYQNFCAGCAECRCGGDCNTRKVYCNYFRYGQCHQEIVQSGPIACRVVSCVPPYVTRPGVHAPRSAVDNATAEHRSPCLTHAAAVDAAARRRRRVRVVAGTSPSCGRSANGNLATRTFTGSAWSPITEIRGLTSTPASAPRSTAPARTCSVAGSATRSGTTASSTGRGPASRCSAAIPLTSDPVAVADGPSRGLRVRAVARTAPRGTGGIDNGAWSGWYPIEGTVTSNLAVAANQMGVFVFARGPDGSLYYRRGVDGNFGPWTSLGGVGISDPSACADGGGVHVFMRQAGRSIWYRRFDGSTWSRLGVARRQRGRRPLRESPARRAAVFVRGSDGSAWCNRSFFGSWSGFQPLPEASARIRSRQHLGRRVRLLHRVRQRHRGGVATTAAAVVGMADARW